jgi:hypothetical protein
MKKKPTKRNPKVSEPQNWLLKDPPKPSRFKKEKTKTEDKKEWNPNPFEIEYHPPTNNDDPDRFMVTVRFDLRIRPAILKKAIMMMYHFYRKEVLIGSRKDRYSPGIKNEIKELQQRGLNVTEIFRHLHPEHKKFKYIKDYVIGGKKKPARELQRIRRISKIVKTKERKP